MAKTVIAIRPEPGLAQTLERGRRADIQIAGHPLFRAQPRVWSMPEPLAFDGLLIGSANAIRHGGPHLAMLLDLPVYAVGQTTADAAREAGFTIAKVGQGGLQALLETQQRKAIRFLRLAGEDHVDLDPPRSHTITQRIVYCVQASPLPDALMDALNAESIVMLHSAKAAEHFCQECVRLGITKDTITLACLGQRITDAVGEGWAEIGVASQPTDAALLALVENLCN